jgi:cysteine desulfurase
MEKRERVYLDWAAASPLLPAAKAAMEPHLAEDFGNPSAIHQEGVRARAALEEARETVAKTSQVKPGYVTFTGGGTEGNNVAIFGTIESLRQSGRAYTDMEVVTTRIEHPSIYRAMHRLEQLGVVIKYVDVNEHGLITVPALEAQLTKKTVLVSFAYINSEIGTIQPLHKIKKVVQAAEERFGSTVFVHIDAAQAPLWVSCQFETTGADLFVLDFAKSQGPKGAGAIIRSKRTRLAPTAFGGGQENGLRPGTENVSGIVGAAIAFEAAQAAYQTRAEQVSEVRDAGIGLLCGQVTGTQLNGPTGRERVANNINVSIPGVDTEYAAVVLDKAGFAVSTKSACAGAGGGESVVVREISGDPTRASATLRITLGPETTTADLESLASVLAEHVQRMATLTHT